MYNNSEMRNQQTVINTCKKDPKGSFFLCSTATQFYTRTKRQFSHLWQPVPRGALGYVPCQKGIIQGHLVHRYTSRRAPTLSSRIVFRTVLSLDVSTQTVFPILHVRKIYFEGLFLMFFLCPCYALVMSNRWNQYNFSKLRRLYIYI